MDIKEYIDEINADFKVIKKMLIKDGMVAITGMIETFNYLGAGEIGKSMLQYDDSVYTATNYSKMKKEVKENLEIFMKHDYGYGSDEFTKAFKAIAVKIDTLGVLVLKEEDIIEKKYASLKDIKIRRMSLQSRYEKLHEVSKKRVFEPENITPKKLARSSAEFVIGQRGMTMEQQRVAAFKKFGKLKRKISKLSVSRNFLRNEYLKEHALFKKYMEMTGETDRYFDLDTDDEEDSFFEPTKYTKEAEERKFLERRFAELLK